MFIGAEVRLDVGFNAAQARLANFARDGLLRHASDDAYRELGSGLVRVGPLGAAPGISKLVAVQFTEITVGEDSAAEAMRWEATGPGVALFPALDADITLTRAADDVTVLAVSGVYRPPLRGLGAGLDRAAMRRVAQATLRTFTHRIGAAITDPAASPGMADTGLLPGFPPWPEPEETYTGPVPDPKIAPPQRSAAYLTRRSRHYDHCPAARGVPAPASRV